MTNTNQSSASIHGLGLAWPRYSRTSTDIEQQHGYPPGWIAKHTGILSRHVRSAGETTVSLSVSAIQRACNNANISLSELEGIIFTGVSREQLIPCTASLIARELQINSILCCDLDATCLSFLVGLDYAVMQIANGRKKYIAVVSCEIPSQNLNWQEPASAVLMGDGAAAAIIGPAHGVSRLSPLILRTYPEGTTYAELLDYGTRQFSEDRKKKVTDKLFHMKGDKLFRLASKYTPGVISEALAIDNLQLADIDFVVPHQASAHAVRSITKQCGFQPDRVLENLGHAGNCLSASIPLLLTEACFDGRINPGDRILLAGTAAGVSIGAMTMVR